MSDRLDPPPPTPLDAIRWRPQGKPSNRGKGWSCQWIAYVDRAVVINLLNGWVGVENWSPAYERDSDGMWCHLTVTLPDGRQVTKTDKGTASNMEAAKGLVSDAFKRAATTWGVGVDIAELPVLWAPCTDRGFKTDATLPSLAAQLRKAGFAEAAAKAYADDSDVSDPEPEVDTAAKFEQMKTLAKGLSGEWAEAWADWKSRHPGWQDLTSDLSDAAFEQLKDLTAEQNAKAGAEPFDLPPDSTGSDPEPPADAPGASGDEGDGAVSETPVPPRQEAAPFPAFEPGRETPAQYAAMLDHDERALVLADLGVAEDEIPKSPAKRQRELVKLLEAQEVPA